MQTRERELVRQRVREEIESHTEVASVLTPGTTVCGSCFDSHGRRQSWPCRPVEALRRVQEVVESGLESTPAHELADQVLEAADKASPGPWTRPLNYNVLSPDGEDFTTVAEVDSKENSAFIAMVRAAAPEMALRLNRGHELIQKWRDRAESERQHAERMDDAKHLYGAAVYDGVARELAEELGSRA